MTCWLCAHVAILTLGKYLQTAMWKYTCMTCGPSHQVLQRAGRPLPLRLWLLTSENNCAYLLCHHTSLMTTTSCVAKQSFPASMGDIFLRDITHTIGLVRDPSRTSKSPRIKSTQTWNTRRRTYTVHTLRGGQGGLRWIYDGRSEWSALVASVCWFMWPRGTLDQRHNAGQRESIVINHTRIERRRRPAK